MHWRFGMVKTEDIITTSELEELFSYNEDDGPLSDEEWTHDGCWVREGNHYRFWKNEDLN